MTPDRTVDPRLGLAHYRGVVRDLPAGTVTFLFTDVEGSTRLLHELGAERYATALQEHRRLLREAFERHGGFEVGTEGDSFFVVFENAAGAVAAAEEAQLALAGGPIRVRMGLHTGTPNLAEAGYVGEDVHLGARIAAAGHGGQVLLSWATRAAQNSDVLELGEHRLKDFEEAVAIFQLGQELFPPLNTISNTNLPRPASSFFGREREVMELAALFQDGARLVTLSGPGGTGKTRLAIEAAAELVGEFKAGVFWVGLAAVRDPGLVVDTIEQTLGAKQPLVSYIGDRELLLLLDNLEQVVEAAPELATVLRTCPKLRLLVTSRELLRIDGEVAYAVQVLADREAVELFCARAGLPADDTVAELCARLDNLPLALELAAARTSVLTPAQMLDHLSQRLDLFRGGRDADPRQRTLRATIAWSYDLLAAHEKQLFARLAAFSGGCILDAAEDVVDAQLDTLQALIEKSLVRHSGGRFWMLETIREFANDLLGSSGEAETLRKRHGEHFLAFAERAHAERYDLGIEWIERLESDHDNLRAALDYWRTTGSSQFVELASALGWFWVVTARFAEGSRALDDAIALADGASPRLVRTLLAAGMIDEDRGLFPSARARFEWAAALALERGDEAGRLEALQCIAWIHQQVGENDEALRLFEEVLGQARALGEDVLTSYALAGLCQVLVAVGDADRAEPLATELLILTRTTHDPEIVANADHFLADCAMIRGDYTLSEQHFRKGLEGALRARKPVQQSFEVLGIAFCAAALARHEHALRLEGAVAAQWEDLGLSSAVPFIEARRAKLIGAARNALGPDRANAAFAEGHAIGWTQATQLALLVSR
jgi:predicted ATPase/class 3 adenylate cyclase